MAVRLHEVKLDLQEDQEILPRVCAKQLDIDLQRIRDFKILRRAIDARKKSRIRLVFTVEFSVDDEEQFLESQRDNPHLQAVSQKLPVQAAERLAAENRVVVVGMGPCGLFAALRLAEAGARVTLIEQGRPVEKRVGDVEHFWDTGELDPSSNVQFGEGGAGTFSDGKLTTRVNHPRLRSILEEFVRFGAPEQILIDARPHIGTDRLREVLVRFRRELGRLGVDLRFETCLTGFETFRRRVTAAVVDESESLVCEALVLAPGHSARHTYRMLQANGVALEAKNFAIGVRVEHPAELINIAQYGPNWHERLPPADYALRFHDAQNGRGVYSFCMCPGGEVINAASEAGGLVVNGMSRAARAGATSNSALVVAVGPEDWGGREDPLAGMVFQRRWEQKAFQAGGGGFHAPAQNLLDFMQLGRGPVHSSCRPAVVEAALDAVLPEAVVAGLRRALPNFDRQIRGFVTGEAILVGVETRTSAPLRILRDKRGESVTHAGLFPAGEGSGHAGGIMSSALDGHFVAEQIIHNLKQGSSD
ncbi:MAG TPA: NAD(P)/FAD-dependent oxidoreductase [Desulfuromonadales bacterium]|nr:NAD(P)/FAD-dependent oxidoreductase [Desulfuromonadales bacterium]